MRGPRRLVGGWDQDPLWATVYDWAVEHDHVGGALWRLAGSDLRLLHATARDIGMLPAGAAVLDLPVGGGVALRALRPGQGVRYVACDISPAMLERAERRARELGVDDQVEPVAADVAALPFSDGEFDLVLSLTGLHCFPDPRRAVAELARVVATGGVLTGSTLLEDSGLRHAPVRVAGRLLRVLGPGLTSTQLEAWLDAEGLSEVSLQLSGPLGYFRAVRR
jgi:SAM-dependent methyltransferase